MQQPAAHGSRWACWPPLPPKRHPEGLSHDLTEVDTGGPDVEFEIACGMPIEEELYSSLEEQAHARGARVETLVNLWLQQELAANRAAPAAPE